MSVRAKRLLERICIALSATTVSVGALARVPAEEPTANDSDLDQTLSEQRTEFGRSVSLSLGPTKPWQTVTLAAGMIKNGSLVYGPYVGSGQFKSQGRASGDKLFDATARAFGLGGYVQYFPARFTHLGFEGSLSFERMSMRLLPRGSDEAALASEKISRVGNVYTATIGAGAFFQWLLPRAMFLDWHVVAAQRGITIRNTFSNEVSGMRQAAREEATDGRFYGLINLTIGMYL